MRRFERAALTGTTERERELEAEVERLAAESNDWAEHADRLATRCVKAEAQVAELRERLTAKKLEAFMVPGDNYSDEWRCAVYECGEWIESEVSGALASSTGGNQMFVVNLKPGDTYDGRTVEAVEKLGASDGYPDGTMVRVRFKEGGYVDASCDLPVAASSTGEERQLIGTDKAQQLGGE